MTRLTQRPFIALFIAILFAMFSVTAFAQPDAPDYAGYRVMNVQEFEELYAAPANSAAYLAPSGERFVHIQRGQYCVYNRFILPWLQSRCTAIEPRIGGAPQDIAISPDGTRITLPTFAQALQFLFNTDIQVLNLDTGAIDNLTNDGYERSSVNAPPNYFVDVAPVWLNDRQIAFARIAPGLRSGGERPNLLPDAIHIIDIAEDGTPSEPRLLMSSPAEVPYSIYVLAADSLGRRIAFTIYTANRQPEFQGVWQVDVETGAFQQLAAISEYREMPLGLAYSADGRYLLTLRPDPMLDRTISTARVLDVKTGAWIDIDPSLNDQGQVIAAGWSPRGSALVYIVTSEVSPELEGVYITAQPGEPGQIILEGRFYGTTCCGTSPINWGASDVILVGRGSQPGILLIQVG
ncbi:MAG: hypothetical protein CUN53_03275 [Phototrophicales bacterium]|nr:MAG: hypothetical protein CUN53_03275 [Phototrophicales bacterium]